MPTIEIAGATMAGTRSPRPQLDRAKEFIAQIVEPWPEGKASCAIAAQLNAQIARGALNYYEANHIQDQLVNDAIFDNFWRPVETKAGLFRTWSLHPVRTAKHFEELAEHEVASSRVVIREYLEWNMTATCAKYLEQGHAVVLLGKSVVANHARTAFQPEGLDRILVHDPNPKYHETTGLYKPREIGQFQLRDRMIVC